MLFCHQGKTCVFIHIPKTGGNSIQATLAEAHMALDTIVREKVHQDGYHRFQVKGPLTQEKHQSLADYIALDPTLLRAPIYACVRRPFERQVSLYFSPHRHVIISKRNGSLIQKKKIQFNEQSFRKQVLATPSACQRLDPAVDPGNSSNTSPQELIHKISELNLTTLKTEDLSREFTHIFQRPLTASPRNVSPYLDSALEILNSNELRSWVEDCTHHAIDLEVFY